VLSLFKVPTVIKDMDGILQPFARYHQVSVILMRFLLYWQDVLYWRNSSLNNRVLYWKDAARYTLEYLLSWNTQQQCICIFLRLLDWSQLLLDAGVNTVTSLYCWFTFRIDGKKTRQEDSVGEANKTCVGEAGEAVE
jgi:ABC-type transport system involved in Fe-S cluster assembly fused permease/ATPase subunit